MKNLRIALIVSLAAFAGLAASSSERADAHPGRPPLFIDVTPITRCGEPIEVAYTVYTLAGDQWVAARGARPVLVEARAGRGFTLVAVGLTAPADGSGSVRLPVSPVEVRVRLLDGTTSPPIPVGDGPVGCAAGGVL